MACFKVIKFEIKNTSQCVIFLWLKVLFAFIQFWFLTRFFVSINITQINQFIAFLKLATDLYFIIDLLFIMGEPGYSFCTPSCCNFASIRTCSFLPLPLLNTEGTEKNTAVTTSFRVSSGIHAYYAVELVIYFTVKAVVFESKVLIVLLFFLLFLFHFLFVFIFFNLFVFLINLIGI